MSAFKEIRKIEKDNIEKTIKNFSKEIELYEEGYNLTIETIDNLYEDSKINEYSSNKAVSFIIFPRLILTMNSIFTLALQGYYYDAMTLLRGWIETLGLIIYFSKSSENAIAWLEGKKLSVSTIDLFHEVFNEKSHKKNKTSKLYGILCDYIHSNIGAVKQFLKIDEKQIIQARIVNTYIEKEAYNIVSMNLPYMLLYNIQIIFNDNLKDKIKIDIKNYWEKIISDGKVTA